MGMEQISFLLLLFIIYFLISFLHRLLPLLIPTLLPFSCTRLSQNKRHNLSVSLKRNSTISLKLKPNGSENHSERLIEHDTDKIEIGFIKRFVQTQPKKLDHTGREVEGDPNIGFEGDLGR